MIKIPISQAKNKLTQIIHNVENEQQSVELTRHGKTAAILLSIDTYNNIIKNKPSFMDALNSFRKLNSDIDSDDIFENIRQSDYGRDVQL